MIRLWWAAVRRRWYVPVAVFSLAAIAVAVLSVTSGVQHTATTTLFLRAPDVSSSSSAYQGDLFTRQRGLTYVDFVKSPELARKVIDRLSLADSPSELVDKTTAAMDSDTVLIAVSVTDPDARRAADIANAYGEEFASYIAEMENLRDPELAALAVQLVPAQEDATTRTGMGLGMTIALAAALASLVTLAIVWLLEWLDPKLRSRQQVEQLAAAPVLATYASQDGPSSREAAIDDRPDPVRDQNDRLAISVVSRIRPVESRLVVVGTPGTPVEAVGSVVRDGAADRGRELTVDVASPDIGSALFAEAVAEAPIALVVVSSETAQEELRSITRQLALLSTRSIGVVVTGVRQSRTPAGLYR